MSDIKQICLNHWGMKSLPFENSSEPAFFYESNGHIEALTRLQMVVESEKILTLITGDYGSGKSMLWSTFCSRLDHHRFITGSVVNPLMTPIDLIKEICFSMGWEVRGTSKSEVLHAFNDFLERTAAAGKHCVVAIDEAHLLRDAETFEEIRLLLNHQPSHKPLLTTVLIGQTELRDRFRTIPQFAQRIEYQWHIPQLESEEVQPYIQHRLQSAGCTKTPFSNEICDVISQRTRGNPREINRICSMAMMGATMEKVTEINRDLLSQVLKELYL
jgi:type II secretory pathway predicted ATPase ExeA